MKSAVFEFFAAVFSVTSSDLDSGTLSLRDQVFSLAAQLRVEGSINGQSKGTSEGSDNGDLLTLLQFYLFCLLMDNTHDEHTVPNNTDQGFHAIHRRLPLPAREKIRSHNDVIVQSMGADPEVLLVLYMWQQSVVAKTEGNDAYHGKRYVLAVRRYRRAIRYLERVQRLNYRLFMYASSYGHPSLPQQPQEDGTGSRKRERPGEEEENLNFDATVSAGEGDDVRLQDEDGEDTHEAEAAVNDIVPDDQDEAALSDPSSGELE